jgi:subtilase family serine protease
LNLKQAKIGILSITGTFLIATLFVSPAVAASTTSYVTSSGAVNHFATVNSVLTLLSKGDVPPGGQPFCSSGSLGNIMCYTAEFYKTAYNFPDNLDGTGSTIVIVDAYGSPTMPHDLSDYDGNMSIAAPPSFTIVCQNGLPSPLNAPCIDWNNPPHPECQPAGWAGETTLDVEMSHSLAPGANIVLLEANSCYDTDLYGAEYNVVTNNAYAGSIMSQSFGEPDDLVTCTAVNNNGQCIARYNSLLNLPNTVFQAATSRGWTVIASTGDDGANEDLRVLETTELTPGFPATSPLVLAAGGTQGLPYGGQYGGPPGSGHGVSCAPYTNCNTGMVWINGGVSGCSTGTRPGWPTSCYPTNYGGEAAWNEVGTFDAIGYVTGGGISGLYPKPAYQDAIPSTFKTIFGHSIPSLGRTTPDVSFDAAVYGGFLAWIGYEDAWGVFGGTSAASPAWAAIVAILNQAHHGPVGFINADIYQLGLSKAGSKAFHDVTTGNNCWSGSPAKYYALPGFDLCTGWGTPTTDLLELLANGYAGVVWVAFGGADPGIGTYESPYNTLARGVNGVQDGGTIVIEGPGSTTETMTMTKHLTLNAVGGAANIGVKSQ